MGAFDRQEGGEHYKAFPIQPAEFCQRNRLPWCEANVVKLVTRHKSKGGHEDIKKAIHYLEMILELEYGVSQNALRSSRLNDLWQSSTLARGEPY